MSLDIYDQRVKLTAETHAVLSVVAALTGDERSAICRQVLHEWAMKKVHEATLIQHKLDSEGLLGQPRDRLK